MLMIGSCALNYHDPKSNRIPKDADYIITREELETVIRTFRTTSTATIYPVSGSCVVVKFNHNGVNKIHEYNIAYEDTSDEMILDYCDGEFFAPLNVLLMLKLSHRYKKNSLHFLKTMRDIQYLRSLGAQLDSALEKILKVREKETYNYDHPSLNQSKESFFDKVNDSFYVWDHDDIHKAVATLDKPAYLYFKPENSEVMVSKKLWNACTLDIQLRAGLEESYVLALERSLVPAPGVLTPKQAFDKALEKVCTSITSGWFREFCWEHYDQIQGLYKEDFVEKFNRAVESGLVGKFTKLY